MRSSIKFNSNNTIFKYLPNNIKAKSMLIQMIITFSSISNSCNKDHNNTILTVHLLINNINSTFDYTTITYYTLEISFIKALYTHC